MFVVSARTSQRIICVDCTIRWTRKENTSAAVLGHYIGWFNEMDCKASCLKSPSCVAIHVHSLYTCLLLYNADVFANTSFKAGVTLLILHRDCPTTSPPITEALPGSTTSVGNATGMHVVLNICMSQSYSEMSRVCDIQKDGLTDRITTAIPR